MLLARSIQEFAEFYEATFHKVYSAAFSAARDKDRALDATQESYARALARWRRVRKLDWREGWVMRTAMNVAHDDFRKRLRETTPLSDEPTSPHPATTDDLDIVNALRSLPHRQREAIVLHYLADLPLTKVAEAMGISVGGVKANLSKARRALGRSVEVSDV